MCGICCLGQLKRSKKTHRVVSSVTWSAEQDALNHVSTDDELVVDLDLDGRQADRRCAAGGTGSLHEPHPSMRDRDGQLSLITFPQCRPCLALDLLVTPDVDGRLADGKRLKGVQVSKTRWRSEERVGGCWRGEGDIVDLKQWRRM